jgi:hypothetical protein
MMPTTTIPNLDDLGVEELIDADEAFELLRDYANRRRRAQLCRAAGKYTRAWELESACAGIYRRLPDWAKFRNNP